MSGRLRVVLADDHAVVRTGYRRLLELEDDMEVVADFGDRPAPGLPAMRPTCWCSICRCRAAAGWKPWSA